MTARSRVDAFEVVYGALIGGLISAFVGIGAFSAFVDTAGGSEPPIAAAVTGLICAAVLMVGGMVMADRTPWMGTALLFGSGFTAIWSVALSVTLDERWFTLVILGIVIAGGVFLGRRRFGRESASAPLGAVAAAEPLATGGDDE